MSDVDPVKEAPEASDGDRPTVVLFRCQAPTDLICPCGRVARRLRRVGVDYETRRVAFSRRRRPEIVELTGQSAVPVLVDGDQVVHDSRRILEYIGREFGTQ
ncbi:MAG: glutathione S-transferase N-terminal domain-containing protein [Solirubrobacterales bacterium]